MEEKHGSPLAEKWFLNIYFKNIHLHESLYRILPFFSFKLSTKDYALFLTRYIPSVPGYYIVSVLKQKMSYAVRCYCLMKHLLYLFFTRKEFIYQILQSSRWKLYLNKVAKNKPSIWNDIFLNMKLKKFLLLAVSYTHKRVTANYCLNWYSQL